MHKRTQFQMTPVLELIEYFTIRHCGPVLKGHLLFEMQKKNRYKIKVYPPKLSISDYLKAVK